MLLRWFVFLHRMCKTEYKTMNDHQWNCCLFKKLFSVQNEQSNNNNNMAYRHRVKAPIHQARVFLPQWFVKVVRPNSSIPQEDRIQLHVPTDMGKVDIRNYLQQIYNIPVEKVRTVDNLWLNFIVIAYCVPTWNFSSIHLKFWKLHPNHRVLLKPESWVNSP